VMMDPKTVTHLIDLRNRYDNNTSVCFDTKSTV
jgi:hypothetical protein